MHGFAEETGAGHAGDTDLFGQPFRRLMVMGEAERRDVHHDVVGALGCGEGQAGLLQVAEEDVALGGVAGEQFIVVGGREFEAGDRGFLQWRGGSHGEEVVHLAGLLDDGGCGHDVTQTPAGDGIGLGERIAGDGALKHARQGGEADVLVRRIDDVFVHLVGDDEGVVLFGEAADLQEFGAGEDLAGGVGGIAEDDGFGLLGECGGEHCGVVAEPGRMQGHVDGHGTGEDGISGVVFVKWREDDDLVPGIAGGHHGGHHGLGAAAGDDEVLIGIDAQAGVAIDLGRQRLAEPGSAPGDGVLVKRSARGTLQGCQQEFGRIEVGETLREINGAMLVRQPGHGTDDGFAEGRKAEGGLGHDRIVCWEGRSCQQKPAAKHTCQNRSPHGGPNGVWS